MATVPRSSIPSMAQKMQSLRIDNPSEKAQYVRIGTLIDAIVAAQRGTGNAPGSLQRKSNVNNLKKPTLLTGSTENIFNGASVKIEPTSTSKNLSHYEAQIDSDPNFSNPTSKEIFTTSTTFKGLAASTAYHIRIRPITKNGQVGNWASLDSILTTGTTQAADFDGDKLGATVLSKTFTFNSSGQDMFCASAGGYQTLVTATTDAGAVTNHTASETEIDYLARRGTTAVEAILLLGIAPTAVDGDGTGHAPPVAIAAENSMTLVRANPIIFFNLMQAASGASFPVNYIFDVQISIAGAAFASSTFDTVWILF